MRQIPWFERRFEYASTEQNILPATLERLAGTPLRLIDKLSRIPEELLTRVPADGSWTIQENAGHLVDLEILWQGRIEDILSEAEYLREYDLDNGPTKAANHNAAELEDLLINFTLARRQTVEMLAGASEDQLFATAMHPRLRKPFRLMDHSLFVADHDDHHLARITAILGEF